MHSRAALVLLLLCPLTARPDDWPGWRGPHGDGRCAEKDLPRRWSPAENVRWKVALPDQGNSTPVVWGDRVFLTQATRRGTVRSLMCFDRANGKLHWQRDTTYKQREVTHGTNPYCSASPVTDGKVVVASFGSAGLVCSDFSGKLLWHKDVGKMDHIWGNASSPILHGDLVILWCGPGERQVLLAVRQSDGKTVWEHNEPGGQQGKDKKNWIGSWSTPVVVRVGSRDELILPVPEKVKAFDPKTGKELWSCAGLGKLVYASPVVSKDGIVLALSGFHGPALAVRAGGQGDVTKTHRLWHHNRSNPQRVGSAVVVGEDAYLLNEQGLASRIELKTGKDLWAKARATPLTWCSPVVAGDRIYLNAENGDTLVLSAGSTFKVLAKNSLKETMRSSVAVSEGELFIRTYKHLWCISARK